MFRDQQNTRYHRFVVEIEISVLFQNTQCSFAFFEVVRYADIQNHLHSSIFTISLSAASRFFLTAWQLASSSSVAFHDRSKYPPDSTSRDISWTITEGSSHASVRNAPTQTHTWNDPLASLTASCSNGPTINLL